ncbi:MAG: dihydrodipicolinate synthase family protein [Desulfurococcales archaeon]|nr:dihydrodipicolinate synthase family protein [Desulfurococcales archaeon]
MAGLPRVVAPMITPYNQHLEVDYDSAKRLAKRITTKGVGVLLAGTTGEMPLLTVSEKVSLLREVAGVVGWDSLITGVGGPNPFAVLGEAKTLSGEGARYLLIPPPYYYSPPQYGIEAFYKWLAGNINSGILVYNIPSHTGTLISVSTLEKLSSVDKIVGVKATVDSVSYQARLIRKLKTRAPGFTVYSGSDELLLFNLSSGGDGGITAGANLTPRLHSRLVEAYEKGDYSRAVELHRLLLDIPWILEPARSLQGGIKTILVEEGVIDTSEVRPPLPPEDEESRREVVRRWRESGLESYF